MFERLPDLVNGDTALVHRGVASVEGDLQPLLANLRYIKEVLAAPRGLAGEA